MPTSGLGCKKGLGVLGNKEELDWKPSLQVWFTESKNKVAIYWKFLSLWLSLRFMNNSIGIDLSQNFPWDN